MKAYGKFQTTKGHVLEVLNNNVRPHNTFIFFFYYLYCQIRKKSYDDFLPDHIYAYIYIYL